jgi:uncharacterized protein YcfJ
MKAARMTIVLLGTMSLALLAGCNESEAELAQAGAADVAHTSAATSAAKTPREVCTEQTVTTQKPVKDENRILGTVAGALVGGVVGNEVGGKGTSGDVATVAGAAAGGYAGNRVQKSVQKGATETTTKTVCHTEY